MDSLFTDNKYSRWYYGICEKARSRAISGYVERHHVIPKSLGGSNRKTNLVALTAREHFVVHLLLVRMCTRKIDHVRMVRALVRMAQAGGTSARYELARKIISANTRGENNPAYGRSWWHDPSTGEVAFTRDARAGWTRGLPAQRGGFAKGRFWITNGIDNRLVEHQSLIPNGWAPGRTFTPNVEALRRGNQARHTKEKDAEHSRKILGRVSIVKDGETKRVHEDEVAAWMDRGWSRGSSQTNQRAVKINDVYYNSISDASRSLGVHPQTILNRIRNSRPAWATWTYA